MPVAKVIGGLGDATDPDVREGVTYTSDSGIRKVGTAIGGMTEEEVTELINEKVGNIDSYNKQETDNKLSDHNTDTEAHNDIRDLIIPLTNRMEGIETTISDTNSLLQSTITELGLIMEGE